MRFELITIFPEFFTSILGHGVLRRAIAGGLVEVEVQDLRNFTHDRHRTVDDRPFGGGEGMVLKPEPLAEAVESLGVGAKGERDTGRVRVVLLSAQGRRFTQAVAREFAGLERLVLLCGRYEGVDERVHSLLCDEELSIGDYVLSGGELAAAIVVDATARLLPGVLGNEASSEYESFGATPTLSQERRQGWGTQSGGGTGCGVESGAPSAVVGSGGLLDYPHYTRPAEFRGMGVPEVLMGGDHAAIRRWRREKALEKTLRNRPDLLEGAELSEADRKYLKGLGWEGRE